MERTSAYSTTAGLKKSMAEREQELLERTSAYSIAAG
jgi:hypothetical protein